MCAGKCEDRGVVLIAGEFAVAGVEGSVERLGDGKVAGVVGGVVLAKFPDPEKYDRPEGARGEEPAARSVDGIIERWPRR